ncbi:hypothetical protein Ahy_B01g055698 [Arachis hypogaea]|uniref:Aminotransferase-like plant mobile domain-containing protein n=1 Tax=Arachis hypogaea TaxID=3818 RepID=A0A445AWV0_ARAHY|nr:hypothetical protein Ahy_B01g055698 [Arachis hypogaea]
MRTLPACGVSERLIGRSDFMGQNGRSELSLLATCRMDVSPHNGALNPNILLYYMHTHPPKSVSSPSHLATILPSSPSSNSSSSPHKVIISSQMLTCDYSVPPDRYNDRKALVNALVERWYPDTHTFHLPIGECAVTLEDVAMILGLPTDGLPVTEMTMSSFEALEAKCLHQFGDAPRKSDCRGSGIKLTWLRDLKERLQLTDKNSIQRYVKCHIMLLIGTILFGDKSGAFVHWKFLPLLRDFGSIGQALCRASRFDCKEIVGPLTLLLVWAWIRLPYLAPVLREPIFFHLQTACMASKSNTHMKDDSSNGTSFAKSIFSQITYLSSSNEIVKGITTSNEFSQINFTPSDICNKI